MPIQKSHGKTAVGVFVDGLSIKYVQLSMKGDEISLRDFKTVALVERFEEKEMEAEAEPDEAGFGDLNAEEAFGGGEGVTPEGEEEAGSNSTVLLGLLNDLRGGKFTLNYALSEPAVTYQEFDTDFGLKGVKLKKRLIEELAATRSTPPMLDAFDIVEGRQGGILTVIREDGLQLYDLLNEVRPFLGADTPNLQVIDSSDIALMNAVRSSYPLEEEEITVIVYVGHDFSRIIFMQGTEYMHFAPIISEGQESPNIENTLYSRILLEQDNIALTRMDRIVLAGEAHKISLLESLEPQFAGSQIEYLKLDGLNTSDFEAESLGDALSEYAVPLMTAWKALQTKKESFYLTNLIPNAILEGQKVFKLAWHGYAVAAAIIVSIVFFYTGIIEQRAEIRRSQETLSQKQLRLADLEMFQARKEMLQGDINRYALATSTYDSLAPGGDRWSRILHYLATSVEDLNSMWLYKVAPDPQDRVKIIVSGRSIYRTRIPRIASIFERATLKEVRTREVRDKVVYEFDIVVEKVDKNDIPEPPYQPTQ